MIADNIAIVRYNLDGEIQEGNQIKPVNLKVLLVWQSQGGEWKLIARQAVKQH